MPRALITGISGQDGSYLSELLLSKGYEVHGIVRRTAIEDPRHGLWRFSPEMIDNITLHIGSLDSYPSLYDCVSKTKPDEIYHLAAQSFVPTSFTVPIVTADMNALGTLRILDSIKSIDKKIKFYQ